MPLRAAVAETLEVWREADSLLAELPPLAPDHEIVRLTVVRLKATFEALTEEVPQTALAIASSQETIGEARAVLAAVRAGRHPSASPVRAERSTPAPSDGAVEASEPVVVSVIPHDDDALRAHVETLLASVRDAAELEARLRSVYPAVAVRKQAGLARLGRGRWYVYRDGSAMGSSPCSDWESPGTGMLLISRDGRYLSADQTAAEIYGVPLEAIPGAPVGAFTKHEGSDEGGRRAFERLAETGSLASTAVVRTPDGEERPIDYRIDLEGDAYRMLLRRRGA